MRVALVENMAVTHHGQVGVALHEAGALIEVLRPFAGQPLPDFAAFDAVAVFGGEQSARDDVAHPYLPRLAAALRVAVQAGQPVLGICLGAQIIARGFGAQNRIAEAREFGWTPITLTDAGTRDPVLAAAGHGSGASSGIPTASRCRRRHPSRPVRRGGAAGLPHRSRGLRQFHFAATGAVVSDCVRQYPAAIDAMAPGFHRSTDHTDVSADASDLALARAFVALARG